MTQYATMIELSARRAGMTPEQLRPVIDAFFEEAAAQLASGSGVELPAGFGAIALKESGGRECGQGEAITKKRFTACLKIENSLKARLRQSDEDYVAMLREHGKDKLANSMERRMSEPAV